MLFADLLSLHLVTFFKFFILVPVIIMISFQAVACIQSIYGATYNKTIEAGCRENLAVAVGPWLLSGFRQCQTLCSQRAPYPQQQGRQTVPQ